MNIAGKTALVTGAAGALGSNIVSMLVAQGAKTVIAVDLKEISGDKVIPIACDVTDAKALETKFAPVLAEHTVDILINNAGILHSAPLVNITNKEEGRFAAAAADFAKVIAVNLSSAFYVSQLIAEQMAKKRTKGVIVNISSVSANGTPGQGAYAASKAGMNALTSVWSKELGMMGIRTVSIAPGYIDTPSTHKAVTEAQLASIKDKIPLRKLGEGESILQAVKFAIENDYVSGTTIEVDGGLIV